jgi:hypothetical protein
MSYKFGNKKYKSVQGVNKAMKKAIKDMLEDIQDIKTSTNTKVRNKVIKKLKKQAEDLNVMITKNNNKMEVMKTEAKVNKKLLKELPTTLPFQTSTQKTSKQRLKIRNNRMSTITVELYSLKDEAKKTYKNHKIITHNGIKHRLLIKIQPTIKSKYINNYSLNNFHEFKNAKEETDFLDALETDKRVEEYINNARRSQDFTGFIILNKTIHDMKYKAPDYLAYDFEDDAKQISISSKYTKYVLNHKAKTFSDLLEFEHNNYVKENFHPSCCFLTAIINKFYKRFNRKCSDGKRRYKELTYKYLAEILGIEYKDSHMGLNIGVAIEKFFKRFKFAGLYIYTSYMELLVKHEPEDSKDVNVLKLLVVNNHLYEMNDNLDSLRGYEGHKVDTKDKPLIKVSDKYKIIEKRPTEEVKELFCNDYKTMLKKIKKYSEKENIKAIKIMTSLTLSDVLVDLVNNGYIPKVNFHNFVYKITFYIQIEKVSKSVSIECCDNNPVYGNLISFDNLEDYKAYISVYEETYEKLIKKDFISDSNEETRRIDDYYKITPVVGCFNDKNKAENGKAKIIDENKAYTKRLMDLKKVPIFNYFDVYRKYDDHDIEDLTYYIIELEEDNEAIKCMFNEKVNRVYGVILKQLKIKYKILQYRRPLKTEEVNFETSIKTLYDNENINVDMKKVIVNKITGLMEQKYNKGHHSKVFSDFSEANYYALKYNTEPIPIVKYTTEYEEIVSHNNFGGKEIEFKQKGKDEIIYVVNVESKERLTNGLCPIKDLIYLNQRLSMYKLYKKMIKLGYSIYGIKTDCLYYFGDDKLIHDNVKINEEIGGYKLQTNKFVPENILEIIENKVLDIIDYDNNTIKTFKNEYDTKAINNYVDDKKVLMIEGLFPGVGKSTLAKNYNKDGLFVCPYNRLCQVLRSEDFNSITYNKIFGLYASETEATFLKKYDISNNKVIVFDEIYLYEPARLMKVDELIKANPDKIFLATGDCDQRDPVGFSNSSYIKQCINIIFKNKVVLNDIKRLTDENDKKKWKTLKEDIFNMKLSVEEICKKNNLKTITDFKKVTTKINVAYFNFRCEQVSDFVHEKILKHKQKYFEGMNIICKKYSNKKGQKLMTNYTYKITKYTDKVIEITDELDNITYTISYTQLLNDFKLPYCYTCDSIQGLSFEKDDKITIFDSNTPYTDRKYLWTAITRSRKLSDVSIFIHSKDEVKSLTISRLRLYFRLKINGYKQQDTKANRTFNNAEYVDDYWVNDSIKECNFKCKFCKQQMNLDINQNGDITSDITVDRINNKKAHIKKNCQLCCLDCNRAKSNR